MLHASAMLRAAKDGDVAGLEALLREDPTLVRATDEHLKTPLHWAALNGHTSTVAWLLSQGADPTLVDQRFASTPEGWAAEAQHYDIRELLRRA